MAPLLSPRTTGLRASDHPIDIARAQKHTYDVTLGYCQETEGSVCSAVGPIAVTSLKRMRLTSQWRSASLGRGPKSQEWGGMGPT